MLLIDQCQKCKGTLSTGSMIDYTMLCRGRFGNSSDTPGLLDRFAQVSFALLNLSGHQVHHNNRTPVPPWP